MDSPISMNNSAVCGNTLELFEILREFPSASSIFLGIHNDPGGPGFSLELIGITKKECPKKTY
jgi:hypothetical protein